MANKTCNLVITLTSLLCICNIAVFGQDYTKYHQSIIKAEEQIFVKNQLKEGLKTYQETFQKYDFVFLQDCITAIQMALYANDEKSFLAFVDKATKNGLSEIQIAYKDLSFIRNHQLYIKNKDKVHDLMRRNRAIYLARIDTSALKKMTKLYAYDQLQKNQRVIAGKVENDRQYEARYGPLIQKTMADVKEIATEKGFPSDKLIGVNQTDIMKELNMGPYDAMDYYNRNKNDDYYNARPGQFNLDQPDFASTLYFSMIIHFEHTLHKAQDRKGFLFHSNNFYVEQIRKGYMHPKEMAFLYDYPFRDVVAIPDTTKGEQYFGIGINFQGTGANKDTRPGISDKEINRFRARYFIAPIENDRAKYKFMREKSMFIYYGWSGYRS